MPGETDSRLRPAVLADGEQLLGLWDLLLDQDRPTGSDVWRGHAQAWFERCLEDPSTAHVPVVDRDGLVVAAAVGTLELGVPHPLCPRGRTVRLANVVTLPAHRRRGLASLLVDDVVAWARALDADRVDLSASAEGLGVYERAGFVRARAPRMKLVL